MYGSDLQFFLASSKWDTITPTLLPTPYKRETLYQNAKWLKQMRP